MSDVSELVERLDHKAFALECCDTTNDFRAAEPFREAARMLERLERERDEALKWQLKFENLQADSEARVAELESVEGQPEPKGGDEITHLKAEVEALRGERERLREAQERAKAEAACDHYYTAYSLLFDAIAAIRSLDQRIDKP